MDFHIRESEQRLLAYLHENAVGYGPAGELNPKQVMRDLRLPEPELKKQASYLAGLGLLDVRAISQTTFGPSTHNMVGIYLTSEGENFMRELEEQPGIPARITVK